MPVGRVKLRHAVGQRLWTIGYRVKGVASRGGGVEVGGGETRAGIQEFSIGSKESVASLLPAGRRFIQHQCFGLTVALFLFGNMAAQFIGGIKAPLACPFCLLRQLGQSRPVRLRRDRSSPHLCVLCVLCGKKPFAWLASFAVMSLGLAELRPPKFRVTDDRISCGCWW